MARLVGREKMVLSGLVCARKIEDIGFAGSPDDSHGICAFIYVRNAICHTCTWTDSGK